MEVSAILQDIQRGALALPLFQRGYVWTRDDVKAFIRSLYRGYPVGGLLVWGTTAGSMGVRSSGQMLEAGAVDLLLDGQQRMTTLYGIIRGDVPNFFDGDQRSFEGLYFNLAGKDEEGEREDGEEFSFYSHAKMRSKPRWINVTDLFQRGPVPVVTQLVQNNAYSNDQMTLYIERAQEIYAIRNKDFHIQRVAEAIKSPDDVVEIFNAVNSGGRSLTKGDLVLARIGNQWPEARESIQDRLREWSENGFNPTRPREWLLRCLTAVTTGFTDLERLAYVPIDDIKQALAKTEQAVNLLLETAHAYLGMAGDVHKSPNAFPVMVKYLNDQGGDFPNDEAKARLMHWYINASIWSRFSGQTDTIINRDLVALQDAEDPIAALWQNLVQDQGDRRVGPEHFGFEKRSSRFYLLFHIMSFALGARDWGGTGKKLSELSPDIDLQLHHIFPKGLFEQGEVGHANTYGNFAYLTSATNLGFGNTPPSEYMPAVVSNYPGALESQWVPNEPELWEMAKYDAFLTRRRELMADAANVFLDALRGGSLPTAASAVVAGSLDADEEQKELDLLNDEAIENGLTKGESSFELLDPNTNEPVVDPETYEPVVLDLAWPNGLKEGYRQPTAVLINEAPSVEIAAYKAGFTKVFLSADEFRRHVQRIALGEEDNTEAAAV
jgi:hypothetical protein